MRVLNALQRIIMVLLLIPVVIICLHALLRALNAQRGNPIVDTVRQARDAFVLPTFRTVFAGRNPLQDEIVTLVAIGVLALAVVFMFRALRSLVGTRPPKPQPKPPAAKPPAAKKEAAKPSTSQSSPDSESQSASG